MNILVLEVGLSDETVDISVVDETVDHHTGQELKVRKILFKSDLDLLNTLVPRCWKIIRATIGQNPMSRAEISRRLRCDIKTIREDIREMLRLGMLEKSDRFVHCPFDEIRVDYSITNQSVRLNPEKPLNNPVHTILSMIGRKDA